MKKWIKKYRIITVLICIVVVGLCSVPFIWDNWFFGKETTIAETLKYVGAFIGGILVIVNAYFVYKRTKEQNRSNNLVAKGQLDTRFKDAATLLASGNTSAELSAIHALHQIAIEASQTEDQKDYVKVIKDILIGFIKENSVFEYMEDENGKILHDEFRRPIIKEAKNTKSNIILQTIIDKLFKGSECIIYKIYDAIGEVPTDLSATVLKGIDFSHARLQGVIFENAQLQGVVFYFSKLQNANFVDADLQNADFWNAYNIDKAIFRYVLWNVKTNFNGTAFENKTIEELTKIMGNPPEPLEEAENK